MSANCQPGCLPPIHLSSFPWLVVASPLVVPHPTPPCCIYDAPPPFLLSSCCATYTSHHLEVPLAFKMPPPPVCWCLRMVVMTPLVALLLLLVLLMIHRLLSVNASPPIGILFASWLSCHPCCCAATASCPLDTPPSLCNKPPPPCNATPPLVCWRLSSCLPLFFRLVVTSHIFVLLPQVSILVPRLHLYWLVVVSHLVALFPPPVLMSTPQPLNALVTHLLFASHSLQLVASVFDLVCLISQFMAICHRYVPTYLNTTGGGGGGVIKPKFP